MQQEWNSFSSDQSQKFNFITTWLPKGTCWKLDLAVIAEHDLFVGILILESLMPEERGLFDLEIVFEVLDIWNQY